MREIKFRVYEKEKDGSMNVIEWEELIKIFKTFDELIDKTFDEKDEEWITMQYTGLKDMNGVEIYEGDIINAHWFYPKLDPETLGMSEGEINLSRLEVMEMRGMLGFYFEGEFMPLGFVPTHEESFEVIGNIYENPELLEVE